MKELCKWLKTAVFCVIGVFIGRAGFDIWQMKRYPAMYEYTSFPWYTDILVSGIFAAVLTAVLLIALWIVRRKLVCETKSGSPLQEKVQPNNNRR